jgi:hypothetical protein
LKNERAEDASKSNSQDDLFKPAKKNLNLFTNASALSNNSSFVFGQNLHERVVIVSIKFNAHITIVDPIIFPFRISPI